MSLHLSELLRVLDLASLKEKRHVDQMRLAVLRQYRKVALDDAAQQLREALDAPNPASARARSNMVLKALDIAVKDLGLPPQRAEQIIRQAVKGRVQSLDELVRLQNPNLSFNAPKEVQARAVAASRKRMNDYWANEQKRFRDDVARHIRTAIRQGLEPEKAADLLEQRLGVSRSRAVLIATDQMLTAAAEADRQRQRDMGIEVYLWRTVGDNRVRPEHVARNGKRYEWRAGDEYPGLAIRCRCRALPVVSSKLEVVTEQERIKPDKHIENISGFQPAALRKTVLRGAQLAGLDSYLERFPLKSLQLFENLSDHKGSFTGDHYRGEIRLSATRQLGRDFGKEMKWGEIGTVASTAATAEQAIQRTFVHELGHYLLFRLVEKEGRDKAEELINGPFRAARATGTAVSRRAEENWQEYFCETFSASVYHGKMLSHHDKAGAKMVQFVRALLEVDK